MSGIVVWPFIIRGFSLEIGVKTITRADLGEAVYRRVGLTRAQSANLVEMIIDEVSGALVRGDHVKLSSFATFEVRDKVERIGRNPQNWRRGANQPTSGD